MGHLLATIVYQALGGLLAGPAFLVMALNGRFGSRWADRLGFPVAGGQKPLWFHAASVGEAQSALTIIEAMIDNGIYSRFVLSVGTPAGLDRASGLVASWPQIQIMAPPVDFWGAPGRALDRVGPLALVIVETELWPELIRQAQRRAIPVLMTAGRMSQKSFERYRRAQSLFQPLLAGLALIATAGRSDQRRFLDLGAAEDQTLVVGNPKFDNLVKLAKSPLPMTERPLGRKVLVAGSTEGDEDQLIVAAWKNLDPRPHLILAPRHLGRLPLITNFLKGQNLTYRLFSEREGFDWPLEPEVLVIDSMGQLAKSYAVADLAIVGGSFWAGQGHNPLEPAAYGVPVIFGPHMDSFSEESADLIAAGAAKTVLPPELSEVLTAWLAQNDPVLVGSRGRELLANREPLGPRLAALVGRAIKAPSNPPM